MILADDGVPHAFKTTWYYELPVGRGKRFGSDINPWLNGLIGNWEFSGTGRLQVRDFRIDDASRLVGMTEDELKNAFTVEKIRDASGSIVVWSLPQDIIENTRRAWNTDPTSPTGYSADGVPTGRYIAPASAPGCVAVYQSDCGTPHNLYVRGPLLHAVRLQLQEALPVRPRRQLRPAARPAERLRQRQFQLDVRRHARRQHHGVPDHERLHRHQHHVRSGRPHRTNCVEGELVRRLPAVRLVGPFATDYTGRPADRRAQRG